MLSRTKALSCGLLEESESLANTPWLIASKEMKKVQISWDRSWHSLDYSSSITSAHHGDHLQVPPHCTQCLQDTGCINQTHHP